MLLYFLKQQQHLEVSFDNELEQRNLKDIFDPGISHPHWELHLLAPGLILAHNLTRLQSLELPECS